MALSNDSIYNMKRNYLVIYNLLQIAMFTKYVFTRFLKVLAV